MYVNMQVNTHEATSLLTRRSIHYVKAVDGMQDSEYKEALSVKRPLITRSLRRSNIRKKIAEYLFEISPSCSYTSEIAYHVKTTPTNVIGAIRGMESRYREDESLLNLDIVEMKSGGKDIKLYGLTPFGKEVIESMKNEK
jgi:predicted transcriptional regulator with HTH domain